jgi:hypothetical protein
MIEQCGEGTGLKISTQESVSVRGTSTDPVLEIVT